VPFASRATGARASRLSGELNNTLTTNPMIAIARYIACDVAGFFYLGSWAAGTMWITAM
jgi:hypothetical protein